MDASVFENCLGKPEEAPEVQAMLKDLGISKKLKPGGEGYVRIELPKLGLLLSFTTVEPKSSGLKFSGVQFYSEIEAGFTRFSGALPGGVVFSDSPKEARAKLGKPTKIMKDFRIDQWVADGRQLQVRYTKALDGIAYILRGFPRGDSK